jgi:hypothetical protein
MMNGITILISFIGGGIFALVIARCGFKWGAASANGELPLKGRPIEYDHTGGVDEEENLA